MFCKICEKRELQHILSNSGAKGKNHLELYYCYHCVVRYILAQINQ